MLILLAQIKQMANPKAQPQLKPSFSYPETPRQLVDDCLLQLKICLEEVPIDSVHYLILRRVIKDIDFTARKIC